MLVERLANLVEGAGLEPRLDQRGDRVACAVAVLLLAEVGLERALDRREVLLDTGGGDQRVPLVEADGDDHHAAAVLGGEVAAERAVHVVAERWAVLVRELRLGEEAEVGDHRERDVGERQRDQLSLTGRRRWRSAARRPIAALRPVAMSHAGSAWLTGNSEPTGPVARAMPDDALTV